MKVAQRSNSSGRRNETPGSGSVMARPILKEPFDRQDREKADPGAAQPARARLGGVARIAVEPDQARAAEPHLVGVARQVAIERFREARGEARTLDHEAHLGIEP